MLIEFTKMHGLGNDFIVIDNTQNNIVINSSIVRLLANRHFGVGCDQLLVVGSSNEADFSYRAYNSDGGEVEQCGNGARCFASFVKAHGLTKKNTISAIIKSKIIVMTINEDDSVCVNMGVPSFNPSDIGFNAEIANIYTLYGQSFGLVSMGNPHAVITVNELDGINIERDALKLQNSSDFGNSVNVGFMQIIARDEIKLRVYERDAGETLACGSGACAAVAYGIKAGLLNNRVVVKLTTGELVISQLENDNITLCGPTAFVFKGKINI